LHVAENCSSVQALDVFGLSVQPCEFLRQIPQRAAGRTDAAGPPWRTGAQMLPRQLRQHAGAHERGLAGAGRAVNHHEMMGGEPIDHFVDHLLAAEKDRPFFYFKGAQAGIRTLRPCRADKIHAHGVGGHDVAADRSCACFSQP
jgi:hypothetical protein